MIEMNLLELPSWMSATLMDVGLTELSDETETSSQNKSINITLDEANLYFDYRSSN